MREVQGQPLPLGINISGDHVNFSVAVPEGERCWLLLYRAGEEEPKERYEMTEAIGEVRFLALEGMDPADYEYNYMIGGEVTVDPYARGLAGRDIWGKERDIQKHEVRGVLSFPSIASWLTACMSGDLQSIHPREWRKKARFRVSWKSCLI